MDEARLKEIENWFLLADWDTWDPTVNRPTFEQAERYGKDLIAALRDAWRERDELMNTNGEVGLEFARQMDAAIDRADRAEAELAGAKSQAMEWKRSLDDVTSREWHQRQHEVEAELERLKAVREAAEEIIRHLGPSSNPWSNFSGEAYEAVIRLRRALSACAKDPAR